MNTSECASTVVHIPEYALRWDSRRGIQSQTGCVYTILHQPPPHIQYLTLLNTCRRGNANKNNALYVYSKSVWIKTNNIQNLIKKPPKEKMNFKKWNDKQKQLQINYHLSASVLWKRICEKWEDIGGETEEYKRSSIVAGWKCLYCLMQVTVFSHTTLSVPEDSLSVTALSHFSRERKEGVRQGWERERGGGGWEMASTARLMRSCSICYSFLYISTFHIWVIYFDIQRRVYVTPGTPWN